MLERWRRVKAMKGAASPKESDFDRDDATDVNPNTTEAPRSPSASDITPSTRGTAESMSPDEPGLQRNQSASNASAKNSVLLHGRGVNPVNKQPSRCTRTLTLV